MCADFKPNPPGGSSTFWTESPTSVRQPQPTVNYEPPRPRLPPRRAAQACLLCRQRRVRCDVSFRDGDCTNCLLDGVECVVVSSKRRARRTPNEKTPLSSSSNQSRTVEGENDGQQGTRRTQGIIESSQVRQENDLVIRYTQRIFQDNSRNVSEQNSQNLGSQVRLPKYIKALDVQGPEELEILRQKAVFDLLPPELVRIVMSRYEEFIHPLLPVLDIADFRSTIFGDPLGNGISLLLYHAVMFIGLNCTENETVFQLSHMAKRDLSDASYDKAKVLFDMEVEKDRMALCQACLLLADRDFNSGLRDASYWVGNAILHANMLGLHRVVEIAPGSQNVRKILWWSVVLKECDVSSYVNYQPRISPFASPMLVLGDFGIEQHKITMDSDMNEKSLLLDTPAAKIASVYILRAKRCCQFYQLQRQMYEEIQPWNGQKGNSSLHALRQRMLSQLYSWDSDVPSELRGEVLQHAVDSGQVGITCAMAMAQIIYWCAYFFIFIPDLRFNIQRNMRIEFVVDPESRPILRHAASQMTGVLERLLALNMSQSLTASHGYYLSVIAFVILQDTQALDPTIRESSLRSLEVCHRVAQGMAETYPILSQITLGFQPTEWQPQELQPLREAERSSTVNNPTYVSNELGPTSQPRDESTEQTYARNSRLSCKYTGRAKCEVSDVFDWVSLG